VQKGIEGCAQDSRRWLQVSFLLPANTTAPSTLDVALHALGRFNFGCVWDTKGLQNRGQLQSSNVTLNGTAATARLRMHRPCPVKAFAAQVIRLVGGTAVIVVCILCHARTGQPLLGWRVSPLQLEDLSPITFEDIAAPGSHAAAAVAEIGASSSSSVPLHGGPAFYRWLRCCGAEGFSSHSGTRHQARSDTCCTRMHADLAPVQLHDCRGKFQAGSGLLGGGEHPPDTFLSTPGFSKVWFGVTMQLGADCFAASQLTYHKVTSPRLVVGMSCAWQGVHTARVRAQDCAKQSWSDQAPAVLCYRASHSSTASTWAGTGRSWGRSRRSTSQVDAHRCLSRSKLHTS
jgi:hypothetical protein